MRVSREVAATVEVLRKAGTEGRFARAVMDEVRREALLYEHDRQWMSRKLGEA